MLSSCDFLVAGAPLCAAAFSECVARAVVWDAVKMLFCFAACNLEEISHVTLVVT